MRTTTVLLCLAASAHAQELLYRVDSPGTEAFTRVIDNLGDVDGDGIDDLILGSRADSTGGLQAGRVQVHSGANGALIRAHVGTSVLENVGSQVVAMGDLNGDARGDYLICRFVAAIGSRSVEARSGADGSILYTHPGPSPLVSYNWLSVGALDDVDGDQIRDWVLGSSSPTHGIVIVFSGASGTPLHTLIGQSPDRVIGPFAIGVGDVDGDGFGDFAYTAIQLPSWYSRGVHVHSGASGAPLFVLQGGNGFGMGPDADLRLIVGAGDVDGDGLDDLAITDRYANNFAGEVRVYSSATHAVLRSFQPYCTGVVAPHSGEMLGECLTNLGDLDGDGREELGLGTSFSSAYAASSATGALVAKFRERRRHDSVNGIGGSSAVITINDLDGDGQREFVVTAPLMAQAPGASRFSVYRSGAQIEHGVISGFGDGSGAACPCGNFGQAGAGCANSTGMGATLHAFGSTSVAADTLYLEGDHLPLNKVTLLVSSLGTGGGGLGVPFNDGLLVCAPPIKRLTPTRSCDGGLSWWGSGLRSAGGWQPGDTRTFQVWYRDNQGPCGRGANWTPAVSVSFTP